MSNGKLLRREEATNNNKSSTEKTQQTQKNPETSKNQLNIPLEVQKQNSLNSDKILNSDLTINAEAKSSVEQYLREQKVLWETEKLSDAQIRKIYEVHNMEKRPWETEVQLNNRKWIVLRELFTAEQIRALMEGKVCGVTQEATTSDVIKVIEERWIWEDPRLPNSFLNAIGVKKWNINSEQLGMIWVLWSRLNNKKSWEVREIFKSISVETRELLNTHNIDLTYIISDTWKSSNIKRLWNTDIGMLKKCINESWVSVLDRDWILKLSDFLMKEELQKCKTIEDVKNVFIKFPSYEFSEADLPLDNKFKPQMKDNLFYKGTEEIFNEIIKYGITPLEWKALSRHKRLGKTSNMYNETQKIEDKYTNTIMNDALKKIPSEKGIFYRWIHISPSKFEAQIVEENWKKIWKDKWYTWSSLTQTMGEFYSGWQILLTIEWKNAKTIEKFWENEELWEAEYLFASGTPFEVVEIQRNVIGTDGKNIEMVVKLKEIDNSKTDHK